MHALDAILIREKIDGYVISKADLANGNKFYRLLQGRLSKAYNTIPYKRGDKESGKLVKDLIKDKIDMGKNVIIFPEGTCKYNNIEGINPLKKGIIYLSYEENIPIVILTVWYSNPDFGQGSRHSFSLRRTLTIDVDGELYFEEIVNPNDFINFEQYYSYISEKYNIPLV